MKTQAAAGRERSHAQAAADPEDAGRRAAAVARVFDLTQAGGPLRLKTQAGGPLRLKTQAGGPLQAAAVEDAGRKTQAAALLACST